MELFELIVFLLVAVLVSSVLDEVLPLFSLPLVQIALGAAVAIAAPQLGAVTLDPELFLLLLFFWTLLLLLLRLLFLTLLFLLLSFRLTLLLLLLRLLFFLTLLFLSRELFWLTPALLLLRLCEISRTACSSA